MNISTPFVDQDNKDIERAEGGCRNCEEVDGCHHFGFIGEKGFSFVEFLLMAGHSFNHL